MNNATYFNIISKIEVIKKTDELIQKLRAVEKEHVDIDTIKPYELRKHYLIEELLLEMIKARLSFTQFKAKCNSCFLLVTYYLKISKKKLIEQNNS